jgi:4-hydroxy-2-oxoheptanedioate aldolase
MKNLKKRLQAGETLNGCWLNLGSPVTAEIVGLAGFDWVLIDLEHGAGGETDVAPQLQALAHTPAAAVVRVESAASQRIHRVLDMGAEGIMCPRISNSEEARQIVRALHYPPLGTRGVAKMVRATGFGSDFAEYYQNARDNILGVVQIETLAVLDHLDEIAALDGVDVLFIGPADLSMELGIFGQFDHPKFKAALDATVAAARKAGKATGILFFNPHEYRMYHELGIRMIACGADAAFVSDGARRLAAELGAVRSEIGSSSP